jgi:hypothetical protein
MVTLDDVARFLGLSKRAVRLRMDALGDMLEGYVMRGTRNRLIFKGEAVDILRRLEQLRQEEGLPIRKAASRLRGELTDDEMTGIYILVKPETTFDVLQGIALDLCRERDQWRDYALSLQALLPAELRWMKAVAPPVPQDHRLN